MSANRKIKFGIIGLGNIGKIHAALAAEKGELVAICDIDVQRVLPDAEKLGVRFFESVDEMFSSDIELDVVAVCTPNGLHFEHTVFSLNNGVHVICEKPMAIKSVHCREMINASVMNNKHLFLVMQNRFNPGVETLKKLLDEGTLGDILSIHVNCFWNRPAAYFEVEWRRTLAMNGGTLFTQFSHFVDLIYWYFGNVKIVQSITSNRLLKNEIEFEDNGVVNFLFENGIVGSLNYTLNAFRKNMEGSITIFAEKGTIKIGGEYLNEISYQNTDLSLEIPSSAQMKSNDYGFYKGSMSNHGKVYDNVISVLKSKEAPIVNPEDGFHTVEIIEKIYKEAIKG